MFARIPPFFGTKKNLTLFWYSSGQFFDSRTDSTFSQYSHEFYHFSVLTQNRPFSGTSRDRLLIRARILTFPSTHPDSTIFRYSHRLDPFSVLTGKVFRYSHGLYHFPVLAQILLFSVLTEIRLFSGTRRDCFSIIAPILPFPGTLPDTTIFRYSH